MFFSFIYFIASKVSSSFAHSLIASFSSSTEAFFRSTPASDFTREQIFKASTTALKGSLTSLRRDTISSSEKPASLRIAFASLLEICSFTNKSYGLFTYLDSTAGIPSSGTFMWFIWSFSCTGGLVSSLVSFCSVSTVLV